MDFKYGFKELKNKDKLALIQGFTAIDTHTKIIWKWNWLNCQKILFKKGKMHEKMLVDAFLVHWK